MQDRGAKLAGTKAGQSALDGLFAALVVNPLGLQQTLQGLAVVHALAQVGKGADLVGECPQHQRRGFAFALEAFEETCAAG